MQWHIMLRWADWHESAGERLFSWPNGWSRTFQWKKPKTAKFRGERNNPIGCWKFMWCGWNNDEIDRHHGISAFWMLSLAHCFAIFHGRMDFHSHKWPSRFSSLQEASQKGCYKAKGMEYDRILGGGFNDFLFSSLLEGNYPIYPIWLCFLG